MSKKTSRKIPVSIEEQQMLTGIAIFSGIALCFCLLILAGIIS